MTEPTVRGQNGGNARKEKLSPERRKEIAREAAKKRWGKPKEQKTVNITQNDGIHAEDAGLEPTVYPTYGGIERSSTLMIEPNVTPPFTTQSISSSPRKHPYALPVPPPSPFNSPAVPETPKPPKIRRKPMDEKLLK